MIVSGTGKQGPTGAIGGDRGKPFLFVSGALGKILGMRGECVINQFNHLLVYVD